MSAYSRTLFSLLLAVFFVGWLPCVWGQTPDRIIIRAQASHTMANAVQEAGRMFEAEHPEVMIVVSSGDATQAFRDLLGKNVELVVASRLMKPDEEASFSKAGITLSKHIVGWDGVALITNPKNPILDVTLEQCRKIFLGEFASWKDLGGPAEPIMVLIPPLTSEETAAFQELVLKGRPFGPNVKILPHRKRRIVGEVSKHPGAIGLSSARVAYLVGSAIRILGLKETEDAVAVLPSIHGGYGERYLLRQPIHMYWDRNARVSREVDAFIKSCLKYGLEIYR
ncbi:MAG: substrate-binding domain-containing protein [Thermodesulfobacteriota bacterium]